MTEIICILLLTIAGLFKGEHESIVHNKYGGKHKLWLNSDWWSGNNWYYKNGFVQWLMRYPLSMLKDGYHFTAFVVEILLIAVPLVYIINGDKLSDSPSISLIVIIIYVMFGFWANISYHDGDLL
ncbi:MAG: hypothetical protein AUJ54_06595 [Ignavibacteria bacterium CG1_02_37_35]|nr:MAG: hypothetical protein AUJ54_06595 [Ignavibacteria bacterium CG1_02_37_35]